jgi:methylphosphotriester-DNA--protein-cysteine methyltransferase
VSDRQLRRRFKTQVGLGIKRYARITRFRRLLDSIRRCKCRFGATPELACQHGFSDQAHLIREVRDFAGLTPAELPLTV